MMASLHYCKHETEPQDLGHVYKYIYGRESRALNSDIQTTDT